MRDRAPGPRRAKAILVALGMVVLAIGVLGCGDDDDDDSAENLPEIEAQQGGTQLTGAERGEELFSEQDCGACHVIGTEGATGHGTGPPLGGVFGSETQLDDGATVKADQAYLERSITDPDAEIVKGFDKGVMSARIPKGSISDEDAKALVAYIKTLK
jgi:mono/diheme cytochrome c family protein